MWELATTEGAGVTTQVAEWQKIHKHRNPRKKDSQIKLRISAKQRISLWHGCYFEVKEKKK